MTGPTGPWRATISLKVPRSADARLVALALGPESAREVPRAGASIRRRGRKRVEITIRAGDAGAMRAALNTYLGWVELSLATLRAARGPAPSAGPA